MRFSASAALSAAAVLLAAGDSLAHIGRGIPHSFKVREVIKPGSGSMTPVRRAPMPAVTDEPSEAALQGATAECQAYTVPSVSALMSQFPTVWTTASIVDGDTDAQNVWSTIQKSGIIPTDVKQKGTGGKGDFSSFTPTYSSSDPDCWYTYKDCVNPKHPASPRMSGSVPSPTRGATRLTTAQIAPTMPSTILCSRTSKRQTLFYIGSNVMDWPLEAQRGIVDGHHVCVHTWSHQYMTQLTSDEIFAELYYTGKAIKDITGVTPRCWRPPYGDVDDRVRAIALGLGMSTNVWSADTDDWQIAPAGTQPTASIEANYNSIINENYETHGNIVLTHEINGYTMDLAMQMYPTIKKHFKNIVPITACMNETNPYPEDITYPNFAAYVAGNIMPSGVPSGTQIQASSASYAPLAAASETKAAGDSSGGSTSNSTKSASSSGQQLSGNSASSSSSSSSKSGAMTLATSWSALVLAIISAAAFIVVA